MVTCQTLVVIPKAIPQRTILLGPTLKTQGYSLQSTSCLWSKYEIRVFGQVFCCCPCLFSKFLSNPFASVFWLSKVSLKALCPSQWCKYGVMLWVESAGCGYGGYFLWLLQDDPSSVPEIHTVGDESSLPQLSFYLHTRDRKRRHPATYINVRASKELFCLLQF